MSFVHRVEELVAEQGDGLTSKAPHWARVPLGKVARVVNGYPFPSKGFSNDKGEPVVRIRDIVPGVAGTFYQGSHDGAPRLEHGELVIGMDGDFNCRSWPGQTALINQRVCKIVPNESVYSNSFLRYALPGYLKLINDHTSAITVKHLSSQTIQDIPLPLPPRAEQDRLAGKLDELFSRIDEGELALERVQKFVERYRQAVLKAAVTGELTREWRKKHKRRLESGEVLLARVLKARREAWETAELEKMKAKGIKPGNDKWKEKYEEPAPPDLSDLPELPTGWVWMSLDAVADVIGGITVDQKRSKEDCDVVPYLRVANVQRGHLNLTEIKSITAPRDRIAALKLITGDILFNEGGDLDKLGRGWIWENQLPICIHQNHVFRARLFLPGALNKIISWHGNTFGRRLFMEQGKQTTNLASLSLSKLKKFPVPVMPQAEADEIVSQSEDIFSVLDKQTIELATQAKNGSALRRAVLRLAFAGALVSKSPDDEPADALLARISVGHGDAAPKRARGRKRSAA